MNKVNSEGDNYTTEDMHKSLWGYRNAYLAEIYKKKKTVKQYFDKRKDNPCLSQVFYTHKREVTDKIKK